MIQDYRCTAVVHYIVLTGRVYYPSFGEFIVVRGVSLDLPSIYPYFREHLRADEGATYDQLIEINLSELEPHVNGPFTPDLAHPLSKFAEELRKNNWPTELKAGLIGSCTNSSYEDMARAASVARQALAAGTRTCLNVQTATWHRWVCELCIRQSVHSATINARAL